MNSERYEQGLKKLMEFIDESHQGGFTHTKLEDNLKDTAPDLTRFMLEFTYGEIYTREGLDNKERALVTIASLATQGMLPQLEMHINAGLTVGLTPNEIIEVFYQLISYTGFPKALNAIGVAKKVFTERKVQVVLPTKKQENE